MNIILFLHTRVPATYAFRQISVQEIAVSHGCPFIKAVFPAHAHSCLQSTKRLCPHRTAKDTPKGGKKVWVHRDRLHVPGCGSAWVALSNHVSSYRNFHPGISPEAAPDYHSNHLSSKARLRHWMKLCHHFPTFENLGFLSFLPGYPH